VKKVTQKKDREELRQELRDLIIRNFAMKHQLFDSEVKELLKEIPLVKELILEEAQRIVKETKVDVLGMFCYQGPPTKHWIETKGQFWEGWNKCCDKISQKFEELFKRKGVDG
jgi:hypothetical protein